MISPSERPETPVSPHYILTLSYCLHNIIDYIHVSRIHVIFIMHTYVYLYIIICNYIIYDYLHNIVGYSNFSWISWIHIISIMHNLLIHTYIYILYKYIPVFVIGRSFQASSALMGNVTWATTSRTERRLWSSSRPPLPRPVVPGMVKDVHNMCSTCSYVYVKKCKNISN